ncbi:MAG TPA: hypothetical protein VJT31_17870 [Rugosimonospora sp.]|nr:hypothetical protein [Rugosimonospora sp.]
MGAGKWYAAWQAALDELELSVEAVEAQLRGEHANRDHPLTDPWRPPAGLGPLPLELRPRADAILARQLAASEALARAMLVNRQQSTLLDRVQTAQRPIPGPVYLDCAM